jgi:hypothetical protein
MGVGIVGVFWPSILFPDDQPTIAGGAAGADEELELKDPIVELQKVFVRQRMTLEELGRLLKEQPESADGLRRFQILLSDLAPRSSSDEGSQEGALLKGNPESVFDHLSALAPPGERDEAAGFGNIFKKLWLGAKEALRVTSYWNMKERAGHVGERGLALFLKDLCHSYLEVPNTPELRVHLVGHSFGARLVSFALRGFPGSFTAAKSPVKSLTLLQGAFSHFAFAQKLLHAPERSGALAGLESRVDGPILVTYSRHDFAVCERYPQASIASRDDAAGLIPSLYYRYGAMGADGAQAVKGTTESVKAVGRPYQLVKGEFLNLNGNELITKGDPPSGAHSDIFYDEIAWVLLLASKVVTI